MKGFGRLGLSGVVRLYSGLLSLYPNRFRTAFGAEIREISLEILEEAAARGSLSLFTTGLHELNFLMFSIIKEHWHEWRSRKEREMGIQQHKPDPYPGGGGSSFQVVGAPGWTWVPKWVVLTTASVLAALALTPIIAALFLQVMRLSRLAGGYNGAGSTWLSPLGFLLGFAFLLAAVQRVLLRDYLPKVRTWFWGTAVGLIFGGLVSVSILLLSSSNNFQSIWARMALFLPIGVIVGCAQWLAARRTLPHAYWIVAIDTAAVASLLLVGSTMTNLAELLVFLILPWLITGIGIWLLLQGIRTGTVPPDARSPDEAIRHPSRAFKIGLGAIALIPLFFLGIWLYAAAQLALAKNAGVYATPEEAVIAINNQGWGGAEVVSIENVRAGPNSYDGSHPHVWFGGATITLNRVPEGWDRKQFSGGSYFIRVREGWVHVPEGAFPEFIGWVMELYGLEGVGD